MERLAIDELLKWKNKQYRKPLIIEGARQVGKTWLVKEFARQNYKQEPRNHTHDYFTAAPNACQNQAHPGLRNGYGNTCPHLLQTGR